MAYKTGHTRTASWAFQITGTNTDTFDNRRDLSPDIVPFPSSHGVFGVAAGGWSIGIVRYIAVNQPVAPGYIYGDAFTGEYGVTISITGPAGAVGTGTVTIFDVITVPADTVHTYTYAINLTAAISAAMDEWFEVTGIGTGHYNQIPDNPPLSLARFFLRFGAAGGSASCGGASLVGVPSTALESSLTAFINDSASSIDGGAGTYTLAITGAPCAYTVSTPASASSSLNGSASASASGSSVSCSVSSIAGTGIGCNASANSQLYGDKVYSASGVLRAMETAYPDTVGMVMGGHVGSAVTASGGAWSASGAQLRYFCQAIAQSTTVTQELNQHAPLSASLSSTDLAANGDEPKLTRSLWRGHLFAGMSIALAATFDLFGNAAAPSAWNAGTSVAGGVATLSPATATLAFTPKVSPLSYRYLKFDVRSVGAAATALSVSIPGNVITDDDRYDVSGGGSVAYTDPYSGVEEPAKAWNFATVADGVWTTVTLDLCAPSSLTATTDAQDSRFPVPSRMPLYYGISRMSSLDYAGIPAALSGITIEVRNVKLALLDAASPRYDYLPTFFPNSGQIVAGAFVMNTEWNAASAKWRADETLDSGTSIEYYRRRLLLGRSDGKASVEESDFSYTKTLTSGGLLTYSFGGPSISGMAGLVNAVDTVTVTPPGPGNVPPRMTGLAVRYPGTTATIAAPASDASENLRHGYLNRNLSATFLAGGGAWFDSATGWNYGFDSTGSVPAQPLYDLTEWYPNCGDAFAHTAGGARTGGISLFGAAILRGGGHALVWDEVSGMFVPVGGRAVRVEEGSPGADRGSGATGSADGYAQTGAPWLRAVSSETLAPPPGGGPSEWSFAVPSANMFAQNTPTDRMIAITPWNRRRMRGAFRVSVPMLLSWLSMDASATGRLVQATTDAAGKIVLRLPSLFGVGAWAETVTTITGARPTARYARHRASGELVLYYETPGGAIDRVTTADEGGAFGMATTVTAAGKYPANTMTPTGAEAVAWWVAGGSVKFRTFDAFGAAITSEVTAVASSVAEDAIALAGRSDGSLVLSYRNTANAIITVVSADGGQTWT